MTVAPKTLTWDDIKDMPESHGRTELVEGELIVSPTPSRQHQKICERLGLAVRELVEKRGLGEFYMHPVHVILDEHVHYEPDLCFYGKERKLEAESAYMEGPPDLVIEVISESNRSHDTVVKYRECERYGVREYWLVDPRERHIRVYGWEGGRFVLSGVLGPGTKSVRGFLKD